MDGLFQEEQMQVYYERFYPFERMFNWLGYFEPPPASNSMTSDTYFSKREFSFSLHDDIYVRYKSFSTVKEFKDEICKAVPEKIDIGAVFSIPPKMHGTIQGARLAALEKEFVFDIDMTDYDDVRTCCSGANICNRCWEFMRVAAQIIDTVLREDFGFKHLLWVYSGRRGIHCWVSDERARKMDNIQRSSIVNYMTLVTGSEEHGYNIASDEVPLHPSVQQVLLLINRRAVNDIYPNFKKIAILDQKILDQPKHLNRLLGFVKDQKVKTKIEGIWNEQSEGVDKWQVYDKLLKEEKQKMTISKVVLCYLYPRIDANVSKTVNHLLKSPFCVHPKTGRVCVTLSSEQLKHFNPLKVPRVDELLACKEQDAKAFLDPYLTSFDAFLRELKESEKKRKEERLRQIRQQKEQSLDF